MKALLIHNRYRSASSSGEDRVVDQEAAALVDAGHDVERFERSSDEIATRSLWGKAIIPGQVLWSDDARRSLQRVLRTSRPDVVHLHNTFPIISPSVLHAARAERIPVVATLHNYRLACPSGDFFRDGGVCHDCLGRLPLPALQHRCYRASALATIPLATGVVIHRRSWLTRVSAFIFLSEAQKHAMAPYGFPPNRMFVKPNFVPFISTRSARRGNVVAYAGRLTEAKGVDLLMDAWDRYAFGREDGDAGLRLVIAGGGPLERRVAAWAEAHRLVDYVGVLTRSECAALLAGASAVVVPSQWEETFGLVAVEAMAAGVAPIAPRHGSFPELITDGQNGVLFSPGSASALAEVLFDLERHRERFHLLGLEARRTYERRFTPEVNVEQLVRIYEFAIQDPAD